MHSFIQAESLEERGKTNPGRVTVFSRCVLPNFHFQIACLGTIIFLFDIFGCKLTQVFVPDVVGRAIAFVIVVAAIQALPIYWHSKGEADLRDAAATLPWFALFIILLPYVQDVAARLGRSRAMQDASFVRFDGWLGIDVPKIASWASGNVVGHWIDMSYFLLVPFMYVAFLLPALTGEVERAEQFVTANFLFSILGTPFFALLPAVGPWYGWHTAADFAQVKTQSDLFLLREPGPYVHHFCAVVCFPSGHAMGAILAGYSLWIYRPLRIPILLLSGCIIFSTLTTGWHYFIDVLGAIFASLICIPIARWLSRMRARSGHPSTQ